MTLPPTSSCSPKELMAPHKSSSRAAVTAAAPPAGRAPLRLRTCAGAEGGTGVRAMECGVGGEWSWGGRPAAEDGSVGRGLKGPWGDPERGGCWTQGFPLPKRGAPSLPHAHAHHPPPISQAGRHPCLQHVVPECERPPRGVLGADSEALYGAQRDAVAVLAGQELQRVEAGADVAVGAVTQRSQGLSSWEEGGGRRVRGSNIRDEDSYAR